MTRLQLLCTGPPAPLAHRGGSSYLVQTGDETLVFDGQDLLKVPLETIDAEPVR